MKTIRKYALCVGLNYPGTSAELAGCVNDALDWASALRARGYEVRVLTEPTKRELVDAIREMIAMARFGDRVVLTYSGHGTRLVDRDADEDDGFDEALVLSDYRSGGLLVDDELQLLFGAARYGVRRLIVSDSCHSGTVQRFVGDLGRVFAGQRPQRRFLDPSEVGEPALVSARVAPVVRKGTVLLSGCADDEFSYDAWFRTPEGNRANGAFTQAALVTLVNASRLKDWHACVRQVLPSTRFPQSPQLSAARHQRYWSL